MIQRLFNLIHFCLKATIPYLLFCSLLGKHYNTIKLSDFNLSLLPFESAEIGEYFELTFYKKQSINDTDDKKHADNWINN